ncbi:pilus assembly protein [Rhodobacteraceae bacterium]|nr:pilus assembly protein [Paracoccaceae bacterium]
MRHFARKFSKSLRRLGLSESGAATVELVIVFPFFLSVFIYAFEVAIMNTRAVMLERATDIVVRDIRLQGGADLTYDTVLAQICGIAVVVPDCLETTRIELQAVDRDNFQGLTGGVDCIKRDRAIQAPIRFENGAEHETMLMRVCSVIDPIFPGFGVGRTIPLDPVTGDYKVIASTAFVNEPA